MPPLKTPVRIHGKASRLAVIFAFGLGLMPALAGAQETMEAAELAKRQSNVEEARVLVAEGDQAMKDQRSDLAIEAYASARELVPDVPALKEVREAVTERFVAALLTQSAVLANRGDLVGANQLVDRVLEKGVAPEDRSALKMKEMLNDPVRVNPAITPKHHADVERVEQLIIKANGAVSLGRFDFATRCYEEILRIDPHNTLARRGMVQVLSLKQESKIAAFDETRAEMILDVEKAWELEIRPPDEEPVLVDTVEDPAQVAEATLEAKLEQIIIPQISLDDVNLSDAIEFLRVASSRQDLLTADQSRRGINFNINLGPEDSVIVQEIKNKRFDLRLQNVPVAQVLKYINQLTGTAYQTDPYAVTIIPASQLTDEVFLRQYSVPVDFISALSVDEGGLGGEVDPFAAATPNQGLISERLPVQELLKRKGVSFGEGASASYTAANNSLLMVNTANNHSIVEQLIQIIKGEDPVIVSVQVTIIKAQQRDLEELGFDWLLLPLAATGNPRVEVAGGTVGNTPGRTLADFASTGLLSGSANQLAPNVITNGLRSGDQTFLADNIDSIINNPNRASQVSRVAPGILSLTGIFSDGGGQAIMRGLSQKKGVDMMARPSVITRSGESAQIVLAREFIYPTEYDPPELQQGGGGNQIGGVTAGPAFPVVPANPTAFETRNVGITLEVLPVAGPNNRYISVTLNPEIVEFDGFVNYGSPITAAVPDALGNPTRVLLTRNEILMPVFSTKRTTNQLTVLDGATVAYGGLLSQNVQAVNDKVPVLGDMPIFGRLFQSKSNLPITTAIVFLVKVDLMDPTGRNYRELGAP